MLPITSILFLLLLVYIVYAEASFTEDDEYVDVIVYEGDEDEEGNNVGNNTGNNTGNNIGNNSGNNTGNNVGNNTGNNTNVTEAFRRKYNSNYMVKHREPFSNIYNGIY